VGSNPTPTALLGHSPCRSLRQSSRGAGARLRTPAAELARRHGGCPRRVHQPLHLTATTLPPGDVRERTNRHAWRACDPSGSKGSNPFVSAVRDEGIPAQVGEARDGHVPEEPLKVAGDEGTWPSGASLLSVGVTRSGRAARLGPLSNRRCPGSRLRPGVPAALPVHRLRLLPSGPDRVHGSGSRRTRPSTLHTGGCPVVQGPRTSDRSGISGVSGTGDPEPPTQRDRCQDSRW
jgi:hypothetical protein